MERDYAIAVLQREARRVLALAGGTADSEALGRPVPCCPGWSLADVVKHLGNVYNWAGTVVEGRLAQPPSGDAIPRRPEDMSAPEWMSDRLDRLVSVLAEVPGDVDLWTFSSAEPTPAFWWRRQAHETLIHRVDAEAASDVAITPVEPGLAADNIDELFEVHSFNEEHDDGSPATPSSHDRAGTGEADVAVPGQAEGDSARARDSADEQGAGATREPASIHLHASDLEDAEWTIDTRSRSISRRHAKADVALRGPAWALARWCWGRPVFDELEGFGDLDAGETWRKSVVF